MITLMKEGTTITIWTTRILIQIQGDIESSAAMIDLKNFNLYKNRLNQHTA